MSILIEQSSSILFGEFQDLNEMAPRLLLLSSTAFHGQEILQWCEDIVQEFITLSKVSEVLFIPYAVQDYDAYWEKMKTGLKNIGVKADSIHLKPDPVVAVKEAECIFIGGGNTFLLLKTLYDTNLIEPIRERVKNNMPFIGSSAGTNVATTSICTTNDMPIVYPPSFDALKLVPFNINPHFLDADPNSTHCGETREVRIQEYLCQPHASTVLGLREGSALLVQDNSAILKGIRSARIFEKNKEPVDYEPGADLSFLLKM